MANSFYQTPTTPKLYVSYPLWQYANGKLDDLAANFAGWSEDTMIKLIQLDPSNISALDVVVAQHNVMRYGTLPVEDITTDIFDSNLWNFDFCGILGHNLASVGAYVKIQCASVDETISNIDTSGIVNYSHDTVSEYDGWSLFNLDNLPANGDQSRFRFCIKSPQGVPYWSDSPLNVGSIFWGKSFTFPQSCNLSTSLTYDYGVKQKQTVGGKTISTANWTKPNNWITEPFGLTSPNSEPLNNWQRRSGRRTWKISFDSLQPQYVMNQNPMLNSNGWDYNFDNYTTQADGTTSEYNINNSTDFFTSIVQRTMGGHLPMVLQINKDDNSPHNFAIVRMDKNYTVTQKSPNLYNIKLTLIEQI